jgi:hypothetical protein
VISHYCNPLALFCQRLTQGQYRYLCGEISYKRLVPSLESVYLGIFACYPHAMRGKFHTAS